MCTYIYIVIFFVFTYRCVTPTQYDYYKKSHCCYMHLPSVKCYVDNIGTNNLCKYNIYIYVYIENNNECTAGIKSNFTRL